MRTRAYGHSQCRSRGCPQCPTSTGAAAVAVLVEAVAAVEAAAAAEEAVASKGSHCP